MLAEVTHYFQAPKTVTFFPADKEDKEENELPMVSTPPPSPSEDTIPTVSTPPPSEDTTDLTKHDSSSYVIETLDQQFSSDDDYEDVQINDIYRSALQKQHGLQESLEYIEMMNEPAADNTTTTTTTPPHYYEAIELYDSFSVDQLCSTSSEMLPASNPQTLSESVTPTTVETATVTNNPLSSTQALPLPPRIPSPSGQQLTILPLIPSAQPTVAGGNNPPSRESSPTPPSMSTSPQVLTSSLHPKRQEHGSALPQTSQSVVVDDHPPTPPPISTIPAIIAARFNRKMLKTKSASSISPQQSTIDNIVSPLPPALPTRNPIWKRTTSNPPMLPASPTSQPGPTLSTPPVPPPRDPTSSPQFKPDSMSSQSSSKEPPPSPSAVAVGTRCTLHSHPSLPVVPERKKVSRSRSLLEISPVALQEGERRGSTPIFQRIQPQPTIPDDDDDPPPIPPQRSFSKSSLPLNAVNSSTDVVPGGNSPVATAGEGQSVHRSMSVSGGLTNFSQSDHKPAVVASSQTMHSYYSRRTSSPFPMTAIPPKFKILQASTTFSTHSDSWNSLDESCVDASNPTVFLFTDTLETTVRGISCLHNYIH